MHFSEISPPMEVATRFSSQNHFHPDSFFTKPNVKLPVRQAHRIQCFRIRCNGPRFHLNTTHFPSLNRSRCLKSYRKLSVNVSNGVRGEHRYVDELLNKEIIPMHSGNDGEAIVAAPGGDDCRTPPFRRKTFKNKFLNFVRFSSVINDAAESFFKSEIRRRLFVTAVLIVVSRIGYFIPLPGFDRRLIPQDFLSFASGSVAYDR
ncbi:hypothetical protein Ahy_A04g020065 isoform F [Arachis hypogaea]|uniref:Uncharacterized protein n=1 Tax=Arachis hypogaea TaxID=3818 RepID=A0A445DH47_ARAHY|nr:hypothetical protein Ahy_A04g020065 isoform F [Arachis hypogaea]